MMMKGRLKGRYPEDVVEFFRTQGKKGGKLSGKARLEKLTPEQRSAIAKKAAKASAKVRTAKAKRKKAAAARWGKK
jgi:hypothetical protein